MTDLTKKVKDALKINQNPMSAIEAQMLAITGTTTTLEKRINYFKECIDRSIEAKARQGLFYHLVSIPEDIISNKEDFKSTFKERGYNVFELEPIEKSVFVISWKYGI